jgi:restriction system-associated AAA family ATPase
MKLIRLNIAAEGGFRSLPQGFEIKFHTAEEGMDQFRPFCFAGLNGSGKSNVLEALAAIFYHLEFCAGWFQPASFEQHFQRESCSPDAFTLVYLIGQHDRKYYTPYYFDQVTVTKQAGQEPQMFIRPYPFGDTVEEREVSLQPSKNRKQAAEAKRYLPAHIVGYSSGENEILSIPFIKSRLVHLDEYRQATEEKYERYEEPENSLIYIDSQMSQAVLLVCLLFESELTLASIRDVENTGIVGLRSFRMTIRLHRFAFQKEKENVLDLIERDQINKLKKCATSWFSDGDILYLDFFVNQATKDVFRHHFNDNAFEAFQLFRLLYELNAHFIDEKNIEKVYQSQGVYTDWKIPEGLPEQDVFHFEDFYLIKELKGSGKQIELLLRNLSDGEHQFLHTMGICLLLKGRRALLLLDEPETHFNPSWRARFIKILNDSIVASNKTAHPNGSFNIHLLKDVLLTSHSPFIISDCLPDNVILFDRDKEGNVKAIKVRDMDESFNTFGTSVEIILERLFNYTQSIGDFSNAELEEIDFDQIKTKEKVEEVKTKLRTLGESIEKDMVLARLNKIEPDA